MTRSSVIAAILEQIATVNVVLVRLRVPASAHDDR